MMWDHGFGWAWWGLLTMLLSWGLLVALVVWVVRQFTGPGHARSRSLAILEERYARGEIDREEFLERRGDLEDS